jgi:hypothetical protein
MCEIQDNLPPDCVTFDDDEDGLSSHKREQYIEDGSPIPEIVLQASAWRAGEYVSGLGDIDFYEDGGDWCRGVFRHVSEIPERCSHQRAIARDLELPE